MRVERISPDQLKLVAFLKDNVVGQENCPTTNTSIRIVRKIYKEREGRLSGMTRHSFLSRAQEILANKELEKEPFCPICFKKFQRRHFRDLHVNGCHDKKGSAGFKCNKCDQTYMCKTSLKYHQDTVHSETQPSVSNLSCNICKTTFSHEQTLRRHWKTVHPRMEYGDRMNIKCDKCEAKFSRGDNLTRHVKVVHRIHQLAFGEAAKLQAQGEGEYKCKRCGKLFSGYKAAQEMTTHLVKKCQDDDTFQCSQCGKPFRHKADLTYHTKIKHSADVQSLSCDLCDFTTQYEKSLIRHKRRKH